MYNAALGFVMFGTWDGSYNMLAAFRVADMITEKHCEGTDCAKACLVRQVAEGCENAAASSIRRGCVSVDGKTYMTYQRFDSLDCEKNARPLDVFPVGQCFVDVPFGSGSVLSCPVS